MVEVGMLILFAQSSIWFIIVWLHRNCLQLHSGRYPLMYVQYSYAVEWIHASHVCVNSEPVTCSVLHTTHALLTILTCLAPSSMCCMEYMCRIQVHCHYYRLNETVVKCNGFTIPSTPSVNHTLIVAGK